MTNSNPNMLNIEGKAPLHIAAAFGDLNVVKILLRNYSKNKYIDLNIREKVLDHNGNEIGGDSTPLHIATESGHIAKLLLANGADYMIKDYQGKTALAKAAEILDSKVSRDAIKVLLGEKGREDQVNLVDEEGNTAISLLINKILENDIKKESSLLSSDPVIESIELLLKSEANLNITGDKTGETVLHKAVKTKREDVFKLLLEYSSNLSKKDSIGMIPLHIVAGLDSENADKFTELLLNREKLLGNNSHSCFTIRNNENKKTPLHIAIEKGNFAAAKRMFEKQTKKNEDNDYGVFVNIYDINNKTPLDYINDIIEKNNSEEARALKHSLEKRGAITGEYLFGSSVGYKRKLVNDYIDSCEKNVEIIKPSSELKGTNTENLGRETPSRSQG